ncbi:hypothetical protein [Streptomyces lavendofoliae]|uniref:hypothetical protein n=1 Tax=Streptomyces lavendofoliae TaxID=67314 RepID=UPI003D9289E2
MRNAYEYHEYGDAEWARRFRTFLHGPGLHACRQAGGLFNQAVGWLPRHPSAPA